MKTDECGIYSYDAEEPQNYHLPDAPATFWLPGMDPAKLITYSDLKQAFISALDTQQDRRPQAARNALTALSGFMLDIGATDDAYVGDEFSTRFDLTLAKHLDRLRRAGRKYQTLKDRKSHLGGWRRRYIALNLASGYGGQDCALGFAEALAAAIADSDKTQEAIAREASIEPSALSRWLMGNTPGARSSRAIARLEHVLGLPVGVLQCLTCSGAPLVEHRPVVVDPYIERLRTSRAVKYRLQEPPATLRAEWKEFFRYKTTLTPSVLGLKRHKVAVWRCVEERESTLRKVEWYARTSTGLVCSTADLVWNAYVSTYLGWQSLAPECGGKGCPAQRLSMALFCDAQTLAEYVEWKLQRSGGAYHSGIKAFAAFCASLTNPKTGYLVQRPELRCCTGLQLCEDEWLRRCESAYRTAKEIQNASSGRVQKSRDPTFPVRHILELPEPKAALFELEERLEHRARMATAGSVQQAKCIRDLLLIKCMVRNPLRAHNYKIMTYREDNTGNLYERADGSWCLRFNPRQFKNERGAARMPYDEELEADLVPLVKLYLRTYRSLLLRGRQCEFVFLSARATNASPWHGLNVTVTKLLWRYLPGMTRPTGPHVLRHIVATDFLKRCPGAYASVSHLLQDTLQTVLKEYGHLQARDVRRQVADMDRSLREAVRGKMRRVFQNRGTAG